MGKWVIFPIFAQLACVNDKMKFLIQSEKMRGRGSIVHIAQFFPETMPPFVQYDEMKKVYK